MSSWVVCSVKISELGFLEIWEMRKISVGQIIYLSYVWKNWALSSNVSGIFRERPKSINTGTWWEWSYIILLSFMSKWTMSMSNNICMLFVRYRYRSTILAVVVAVCWGDWARVLNCVFSVVFPIYLILLFT